MTRIIAVTGASRGLGRAVAEMFGRRGDQIIAVARTVGGLEELDDAVQETGGPIALLVPLDIADGDGIDRLGGVLFEKFGRLDGWVHTAATTVGLSPVSHLAPKDWERLFAVNATAVARLIGSFEGLLAQSQDPRIVFVTDDKTKRPHWSGYGASKAAGAAIASAFAAERESWKIGFFEPNPMPTAIRARSHPGEERATLTAVADEAERLVLVFDSL
jgi:NAD(P)-dependent dehydrogenase (short-subunit alcohol dehydrogenase family)